MTLPDASTVVGELHQPSPGSPFRAADTDVLMHLMFHEIMHLMQGRLPRWA